jgi:hypothetical protein
LGVDMSGYRYGENGGVYDGESGEYIGQLDLNGKVNNVVKATTNPLTGGVDSLSGPSGPVMALGATIDQRDAMGRVTQYTTSGVSFSVTYGDYGIVAITGGGMTRAISYNSAGQITGVSNAVA